MAEPSRRTIVITGASDGIGAAAARELHSRGHRVVVVGRSPGKTAAVAAETGGEHELADFADLSQVRDLAGRLRERCERIDVLLDNAGGLQGDRAETTDGFERTLQINHLAPFLLTTLLLDRLVGSRATVAWTSSQAHRFGRLDLDDLQSRRGYRPMRAYGSAKLANLLTARELQRRHGATHPDEDGVFSVSLHPGVVATQFAREGGLLARMFYRPPFDRFLVTAEQGADQLVWLSEGVPWTDLVPGTYYVRRTPTRPNAQGRDDALAARLWDATAELVRPWTG